MEDGTQAGGGGLAEVLRRVALDGTFAASVVTAPIEALRGYDLTAADLSALSLWLEHPEPGQSLSTLFEDPATGTAP